MSSAPLLPRDALYWIGTRRFGRGFPPLDHALDEPNGLLALGGDLSVERLVEAYGHGIFPWYSTGQPIMWWSPDPRAVLEPAHLHVSRSLAKRVRNAGFTMSFDEDFAEVVRACAAPRAYADSTWITDEMHDAYCALHAHGIAHSVECRLDGALVGGLYGVALGRMFFGESMFSTVTDASKVALVALCRWLEAWDYALIDCQMDTAHLRTLGARTVARSDFAQTLRALVVASPAPHAWRADAVDATPGTLP